MGSVLTAILLGGGAAAEVLYRLSSLGRLHRAVKRARRRLWQARGKSDEYLEASRARLEDASRHYVRQTREDRRNALTVADMEKVDGMPPTILGDLERRGRHHLVDIDRLGVQGLRDLRIGLLGEGRSRDLVTAARKALQVVDEDLISPPPVRDPSELPAGIEDTVEARLLRAARQWYVDRDQVEGPRNDLAQYLDEKSPDIARTENRSGRWSWLGSLLFGDWTETDVLSELAERIVRKLAEKALDGLAGKLVDYGVRALRKLAGLGTRVTRWLHRRLVVGRSQWAEAEAPALLERADGENPESLLSKARQSLQAAREARGEPLSTVELYGDYQWRNAHYGSILGNALGEVADQPIFVMRHIQGGLPEEIVDRVEDLELDVRGLRNVEPRRYQVFGMRYLVVQERTLLGDEMGIGKTLQALGVMAHLAGRERAGHFMVIAPASVTLNWIEEARRFTKLPIRYLAGPRKHETLREWKAGGGLAIISFQMLLRRIQEVPDLFDDCVIDFLAVDEAHMVKKATNVTSRAVQKVVEMCRRVTFMTGTPLESEFGELKSLIARLQLEVAEELPARASSFEHGTRVRQIMAPVYLRRNQKDVMTELPERIEKEEWIELDPKDLRALRKKVRAEGLYLEQQRRAVTLDAGPAKLEKLQYILDLQLENRRKILVFSRYRDVLRKIAEIYPEKVFGTIWGGPTDQQKDALWRGFNEVEDPCILLLQIEAGGYGINLHTASAVVLVEPQWTYTKEEQAIRRAYRMGQVRRVEVHRLLTQGTIEEDIHHVKTRKKEMHEIFVEPSAVQDEVRRRQRRRLEAAPAPRRSPGGVV